MADVKELNGLHVGSLTPFELVLFNEAVKQGLAERSYEGAAGFMGLAKVRVIEKDPS